MKRIKYIISLIIILNICFLQGFSAFAQDDDLQNEPYYFKAYDVNIIVNEDNSFDVTENINAYFNESRHGIYRTIPLENQVKRADGSSHTVKAKIKNIKVSEEAETDKTSSYCTIKIGNADTYIEGEHSYKISYTYTLGEDTNVGFDELYYNIIGNSWDTYIQNVTFKITMPKAFDKSKLGFSTGEYGTAGTYDINYNVNENVITGNVTKILEPNEALTVRLELDEGYFYFNKALYNFKLSLLLIIPIIVLITVFILWLKYGKDEKAVETVEFYPPDNMNSAELIFWRDGIIASNEKLTALLIELANDGYVQIEEIDTGNKRKSDFVIKALKSSYTGNDKDKEIFFNGLFSNGARSKVYKEDLEDSFYNTLNLIRELHNEPKKRHMVFNLKSLYMRIAGWVLSALSLFAVLFNFSNLLDSKYKSMFTFIGVCISVLSFILSFFIRKRTDEGTKMLGRINGFKNFLESAEKEKLEELVNDNPEYFYNILPYAYVLGVSDKWMKKFEGITMEAPHWYYSYYPYSYITFGRFMRNTMSTATNYMVAMPKSSGSGGGFSSGGGGFSGGGVGGGGGGSW